MLQHVELSEEQKTELQEQHKRETEVYKRRSIMMLELGSQYSSDYDEISESQYITTDGEDNEQVIREQQRASTVEVLRDRDR